MSHPKNFIYGEALAAIHAAGFEAFAIAAAEVVERKVKPAGLVLDLGCGAGPLSERLVALGYEVWGADISAPFLEEAGRRVPSATFVQGSVYELPLPPASAVCAVGEIFNYTVPGNDGLYSLLSAVQKVHAALPSGGLFLFDLSEPGRAAGGVSRFTERDGWAVGMNAQENGNILTRRISCFRRQENGQWEHSDETHTLRLYDRDEVIQTLAQVGFDVSTSDAYGDHELPPHHIRYDAVKI